MGTLLQDLRYSFRLLAKRPSFTAVVVFTMALGIGANSAVFSVVNAFLLRPLPYKQAERLVMIQSRDEAGPRGVSFVDYLDWREQQQTFDDLAFFNLRWHANVEFAGETETLKATLTAWNLFSVLQVEPALGRTFLPEDDDPARQLVVILSHGLWQRRFGADPDVLGQKLRIDGGELVIVGVMAQGMKFPSQTEMWISAGRWFDRERRGVRIDQVVARLRPDVTIDQGRADLQAVAARLAADHPDTNSGVGVAVTPLRDFHVRDVRGSLLLLLGACGFVLLIACANVANLLLARASSRRREVAIRAALGATRLRLVRQMLTESALLGVIGGGLGLLVALWAVEALRAMIPVELPFWIKIDVDLRVLTFTLAISLMTGFLFGLMPALHASRLNLNDALKEGARTSEAWSRNRVRSLLVVSEVALAFVLLAGAGLMMRSLLHLQNVNPGFDPRRVLMMGVNLTTSRNQPPQQKADLYRRVVQRLEAAPGVESVGINHDLPFVGQMVWDRALFTVEGQSADAQRRNPPANLQLVSPDYFRAMTIPLVEGRFFDDRDRIGSPNVVIVSRKLAEAFWPGESPLGRRIKLGDADSDGDWNAVVGVVGDVKYHGLASATEMDIYSPCYQAAWAKEIHIVARTQGDPASMAAALRKEIWSVSPALGVSHVVALGELAENTIWQPRLWGMLFGAFSVVALVLSAAGIYGVLAYTVSQREREIGIRMALGAGSGDVLRLIVKQSVALTLAGVAIGLVAALALTQALSSMLYGVSATDPATFAVISVILIGSALGACFVPARRALRVDPIVALRSE